MSAAIPSTVVPRLYTAKNFFQVELLRPSFDVDIKFRSPPMEPQSYPFLIDTLEERGYRVFPEELENDDHVFFHATAAEKLDSILETGLRPGIELGGNLATISYATNSMIPLTHWVTIRTEGQDGVILALRFKTLDEIFVDGGTHRSLALGTQPAIIGVCTVPSAYEHR
jgi:hypothetical protein